jgi:hypothetical protein
MSQGRPDIQFLEGRTLFRSLASILLVLGVRGAVGVASAEPKFRVNFPICQLLMEHLMDMPTALQCLGEVFLRVIEGKHIFTRARTCMDTGTDAHAYVAHRVRSQHRTHSRARVQVLLFRDYHRAHAGTHIHTHARARKCSKVRGSKVCHTSCALFFRQRRELAIKLLYCLTLAGATCSRGALCLPSTRGLYDSRISITRKS